MAQPRTVSNLQKVYDSHEFLHKIIRSNSQIFVVHAYNQLIALEMQLQSVTKPGIRAKAGK